MLDRTGAVIVFQEKGASWAGMLAFSSETNAREFVRTSMLEVAEIAAFDCTDAANVAALIASVKPRAVRYMLLDLDYRTGRCIQIEFEGDGFGVRCERQMSPARK